MKRGSDNSAVLDQFISEVGRAAMSGDAVGVVLRHVRSLLGGDFARLVLDDSTGGRCWVLESERVEMQPLDEVDRVLWAAGCESPGQPVDCEVNLDGAAAKALVAVRRQGDDETLMLAVGRRGRGSFDDRAERLFRSIFTFAEVALQNMLLLNRVQEKAAALEHLANHDPLTGLANRLRFQEESAAALAAGTAGAVLLIDLDRFKEINDTLGHHTGDQLLVEVAYRIRFNVGRSGVIARLGGDEFAVLFDAGTYEELRDRAERLHRELERPVELGDVEVDVGASIGVAVPGSPDETIGTLLRYADVAMYTAKAARSGVEFYRADLDHYRPESLALVPRFRGAIERGELGVAFQPQLDVREGRIVGAEALVRWSLPGVGPVPPSEFIPIAESTGLIRPLTRYVLIEAIEQCASWQALGDPVRVSVNIAPRVLLEPGLADRITHLLDMARLPPALLRLEVTETTVMTDPDRSLAVLRELCDRGMSIAIDDFGTGHSSLAYLTSLPCDELKIDRAFITAMEEDPRTEAVVSSVVGLGHSLGLDVVAEGVETTTAADQLVEMGCRIFQGYRYGRPVPAVEFARLLEDRPRFTQSSRPAADENDWSNSVATF